jgi:hypothetical protein
MSWRSRSTVDDEALPTPTDVDPSDGSDGPDDRDHHGFWDSDRLDTADNDDAFAIVLDAVDDESAEDETLLYMGNLAPVEAGELTVLAAWAESKACRTCIRRFADDADDQRLKHEDCRKALHTGRLLRRYL